MKYSELEDQMMYDGYSFGGINQFDIEVCAESTCGECGHKGLKLASFKMGNSYRAFAVCPKCDDANEF